MAHTRTVLTAFVASPGDLAEERESLESIIKELNVTWSKSLGIAIDLVKWETHSYPAAGTYAQGVINSQIGNEYDIFIGIMWSRFGTPTPEHGSGTEEEFQRAFERHSQDPSAVQILFYFKDAPIAVSEIDPNELRKLNEFKQKLGKEGVYYWRFRGKEEFSQFLRLHLSRIVQNWKSQPVASRDVVHLPQQETALSPDDLGLLDHIELTGKAFSDGTLSLNKISFAAEEIGRAIKSRTEDLEKVIRRPDGSYDVHAVKRVSKLVAEDLNLYSARTEAEIPIVSRLYKSGVEHITSMASIAAQDFNTTPDNLRILRDALAPHEATLEQVVEHVRGFRDTLARLPRTESEFNRARKKAVQVLEKLLAELHSIQTISGEALKLTDDLIERQSRNAYSTQSEALL